MLRDRDACEKRLKEKGNPLTEEEIELLKRESKNPRFWDQPWPLQTTFLMLFLAAIVQGWNQTATNGANLSWAEALHLGPAIAPATAPNAPPSCGLVPEQVWKFAAVNAAPYLAASG